jgi:AI-2 transport protein TqsA
MEARIQTACLMVLSTIAVAAAMYWLAPVMIPFVLALFIALGLSMLVEILVQRAGVPRVFALPVTLVLGLVFLLGVGTLISASVGQLAASAPTYSRQLGQLVERSIAALPPEARTVVTASALDSLKEIPVSAVGTMLGRTTNAILNILSQSLLVLIFVLFLLMGERPSHAAPTMGVIRGQVQGYLVRKAGISAVTGVLVGAALAILGVPFALMFGLFAFLLNFIPSIGSLISTLLPLPVVIVSPDISFSVAVLAIAVPAVIQIAIGNFVEPKMMGESLDLHPAMILVSLIFWGMLWGVVGMLLATPITAVLKILLEKSDTTRPVAHVMAGRLDALGST